MVDMINAEHFRALCSVCYEARRRIYISRRVEQNTRACMKASFNCTNDVNPILIKGHELQYISIPRYKLGLDY
jgi:hypothetical protein